MKTVWKTGRDDARHVAMPAGCRVSKLREGDVIVFQQRGIALAELKVWRVHGRSALLTNGDRLTEMAE
jgi:hypothetical protein